MEEGLQALDLLHAALNMEEGLRPLICRDSALRVEVDEAYVPGFAFLVALRHGRLLLVVLDEVLPLVHALGSCSRRWF